MGLGNFLWPDGILKQKNKKQTMANALKDAMYDETYLTHIYNFMTITSKEFAPQEVVDVLASLKSSVFVQTLMVDPMNKDAATCIHAYLQSEKRAPAGFLERLRSLFQTQIKLLPSVFGPSMSAKVKVNVNNIEPTTRVSDLTAKNKSKMLKENLKNFQTFSITQHPMVPQHIRLKMDQTILDNSMRGIILLANVIAEGNRQNGRIVDDYIKRNLS